jgi:hypothetical protein
MRRIVINAGVAADKDFNHYLLVEQSNGLAKGMGFALGNTDGNNYKVTRAW